MEIHTGHGAQDWNGTQKQNGDDVNQSTTLLYPSEDFWVTVRFEHHVSRSFLGRTYPKDVTLLLVAVEARLALKQLFQVSCMLCATQPAFLLRYAERLTHTVASACARFYSRRQQSQLPPSQPDPSWTTNGKPKLSSEDVLCRLILSKHWTGIQGYRWANTVENINKIEWKWIWCRVCVLES